jgi:hypothetical protein
MTREQQTESLVILLFKYKYNINLYISLKEILRKTSSASVILNISKTPIFFKFYIHFSAYIQHTLTGVRCVRKEKKIILYNTTRGRTHFLPFF